MAYKSTHVVFLARKRGGFLRMGLVRGFFGGLGLVFEAFGSFLGFFLELEGSSSNVAGSSASAEASWRSYYQRGKGQKDRMMWLTFRFLEPLGSLPAA